MKEMFLNNSIKLINDYSPISSAEKKEKLLYGLEGIYLTFTKLVVIIILALVLNITKEVFLLLLFYNFLRFFGFGFHAETSKECLVISVILFTIIPFLIKNNILIINNMFLIWMFCFISFVLFAPADTVKRPMINKKKKLYRKLALLIITSIYLFSIMYIENDITMLVSMALIFQSLMVNPITYKIFGQPYNNYKNYNG